MLPIDLDLMASTHPTGNEVMLQRGTAERLTEHVGGQLGSITIVVKEET